MKPTISECQNFLEYDNMKFMAFENEVCEGCHFTHGGVMVESVMVGAYCSFMTMTNPISLAERRCARMSRKDNRNIIWIRVE